MCLRLTSISVARSISPTFMFVLMNPEARTFAGVIRSAVGMERMGATVGGEGKHAHAEAVETPDTLSDDDDADVDAQHGHGDSSFGSFSSSSSC